MVYTKDMAQRLDDRYKKEPEKVEGEIELALGWLDGTVTADYIAKKLRTNNTWVYTWVSPRLKLAHKHGKLIIKQSYGN